MAGVAAPSLGQVTSRELKRVLSEARWTVTEASRQLGVDRRTVHRWLKGAAMPLEHFYRLVEKSGRSVTLVLGQQEKAAPHWAERLVEDVPAIRADVERVVTELVTLKVALEAIQSGLVPPDDDPADDPAPLASGRKRDQ